MSSETLTAPIVSAPSKTALWSGRILGGLLGLMVLMGGVTDIVQPAFVVEELTKHGFPRERILPLGIVTVVAALLYLIPQTSLIGALLLTGYLGGAVFLHTQAGDGIGMILAPVVFASLLWVSLLLCEPRLRALLPLRR